MAIAADIVERLRINPEHYGTDGTVNVQNSKKASGSSCC
jgi:hypothetical protein